MIESHLNKARNLYDPNTFSTAKLIIIFRYYDTVLTHSSPAEHTIETSDDDVLADMDEVGINIYGLHRR